MNGETWSRMLEFRIPQPRQIEEDPDNLYRIRQSQRTSCEEHVVGCVRFKSVAVFVHGRHLVGWVDRPARASTRSAHGEPDTMRSKKVWWAENGIPRDQMLRRSGQGGRWTPSRMLRKRLIVASQRCVRGENRAIVDSRSRWKLETRVSLLFVCRASIAAPQLPKPHCG